jgi:hypothetical protein
MSSEMVELPLPAAEGPSRLEPRGYTFTTAGGAAR